MFQHEFHVKWSNTSQQPDKARIFARSIVFYNDICEMLLLANVFQIADPKSRVIWNRMIWKRTILIWNLRFEDAKLFEIEWNPRYYGEAVALMSNKT